MLKLSNIDKFFGGLHAVDNVSIKIKKGSITGLIGPNGAGKTPLFNIIAAHIEPSSGKVEVDGANVSNMAAHELFSKGLLRTFQIAQEFSTLTVLENLMMVPGSQKGESLINTWFNNSGVSKQEEEIRSKAIEVIDFLNLSHLTQELAGNLSGGQKKLLDLRNKLPANNRI